MKSTFFEQKILYGKGNKKTRICGIAIRVFT